MQSASAGPGILLSTTNRIVSFLRQCHAIAMKTLLSFLKEENGQDLIEYTLLIAFIALASAAIFVNVGGSATAIWGGASNQLSNAAVSAS